MQSPDVFICHAGAQKKEFVDSLRVLLQQYHRLDVVVSEDGLKFGDDAPRVTQQQLEAAAVAVVVLSPEFLTRKALLDEVRCILNQRRSNGDKQKICVVFHKVTVEQCSAMNAEGALTEYREDIRELCRFTCIREDKAGFYQGEGKSALAAELAHTLYANGQLPGGAYPVDLSLADTEAALADQVAAQLINQLGNMEGAGKLAASPTWASLVQWLNRNDHALLLVLENVEAVIEHQKEALRQLAERLAELCRFNALLLTIMSGLINGGRCSIEDALADAEQGGPLSLLEGARAGGALDDHQIRHADAWLLKHLSPREQEAIARLSLFRGSISLDNTLLMVGAPAESSPQLQEMLDRSAQSTYTVQALHRLQNALSWLYRGVLVDGRTSALLLTSLVVLLVALAGAWHLDAGVSQVVLYQRGPMPSTAGGAAFALDAPVQPGYWIAAYYPTEHDSGSLVECIEVELARVIDRSAIDVQSAVNASTAIYVHVLHSPADKITLWQLQQALRDDFERVFMTGGPGWQGGGEVYEVKQKGGVLSLSIFKRPPSVRDALYVIVPAGDGAKFMVIHGSNLLRHANLVYKWRIGNFGKLHVLDLVNKHSLEQLKLQKLVAEQDSIVTRPPEPPLMGSQPMYLELWQGQLPVGPPIPVSWPSLVEVLWMAVLQHKLAVLLALAMLPLIWVCLYKRSVEQPSLPGSPAPESRPAVGSPASSSAGAEKETWIFVCHAGPDNPTAEDLRRALNRDGLKLFVDQDDIPMGMAGDDVMSRAMAISQAAIILLSEDLLVDTALIAAVCKLVFNHLQRHAGVHHKGEYEPGASFQPQTPQTLQRRVADAVRSWKL
ncbi:hypothetical protein WJX72_005417 [[Myrmecia] bisecta]|uniref:TIR domain-containing protein n=1 Tax=[Myrmecia] bisecta TaxID=41462 RepID=A0AAW1PAY4_9CHLO